jgi:hypothetical protein
MQSFSKKDQAIFKKLNTPSKVQSYLNKLPFNFEEEGHDTIKSPFSSVETGSIHCFEGALLGAYILSLHGQKPLVMHLKATKNDFDHVVAPFQVDGYWGAISKTNHYCLRFRDPVYKSIRELAMSYFHEYFLNKNGLKTMRSYSNPFNLNKLKADWVYSKEDLWEVDEVLDKMEHHSVVSKKQLKNLRPTDLIERQAGNFVDWKPVNKKFKDPNLSN